MINYISQHDAHEFKMRYESLSNSVKGALEIFSSGRTQMGIDILKKAVEDSPDPKFPIAA